MECKIYSEVQWDLFVRDCNRPYNIQGCIQKGGTPSPLSKVPPAKSLSPLSKFPLELNHI